MISTTSTSTDCHNDYRPLSTLAVIGGILGGTSILAWMDPSLVAVATIAAITGFLAVVRLWGKSADVAGLRLAVGGLAISSVCLVGASVWHWHRYTIEVPAGFDRLDLSNIFDAELEDVTPNLLKLRGRHIAVKAYIDPFYSSNRATSFTISRMDSTGFGATARPGEVLVIELAEGSRCEYGPEAVVVSGVFDIERDLARDGPRFRLILREAALRPATSSIGLPVRNPRAC